jgi:ribosomal protein S27AE
MSGEAPRPTPPLSSTPADVDTDDTTCPRCGESRDLAKVKGCIKCLKCGFKFDCNGW